MTIDRDGTGRQGTGRQGVSMRSIAALAVLAVASLAAVAAPAAVSAQNVALPQADLQLVGSVDEGPPGGGITTNDTMSYRLTIRNQGPTEIPARGLLLVLYVDYSAGSEPWPMEVARFDAPGLRPPAGGACGVGRRDFIQCTNIQALPADGEIEVRIEHRHPEAVAGALTFVAEVNLGRDDIVDPAGANNTYRGPTYGFINPPTTTSTSTSTTTSSSGSSSSSSSSSTSSTIESTTSSSTTIASSSTTTTIPTTTTASTTLLTTTTSITPLSGSATLVPSSVVVAAAEGSVTATSGPEDQVALGPAVDEPDDGPPYVLLGAAIFVLLVLGGVGLAAYAQLTRDPPLVDIRTYE